MVENQRSSMDRPGRSPWPGVNGPALPAPPDLIRPLPIGPGQSCVTNPFKVDQSSHVHHSRRTGRSPDLIQAIVRESESLRPATSSKIGPHLLRKESPEQQTDQDFDAGG